MSTMYSGGTSLNFIIGMRLWPPDSNFASGPSFCSRAIASSSVRGEKYSKLRGIIGASPFLHRNRFFVQTERVNCGKATIIRGSAGNVNMDQSQKRHKRDIVRR